MASRVLGISNCSSRAYSAGHGKMFRYKKHFIPLKETFRGFRVGTRLNEQLVPLRKQLKEESKRRKAAALTRGDGGKSQENVLLDEWKLSVGIEVHAQLNTERKLFSQAGTSLDTEPNTNTTLFDLALPGSQPRLQVSTLLPAIRAALALNCKVQRRSTFDRKHYFYPDQPAGYQITQYYHPFAKDGLITLDHNDGIAENEEDIVRIGIKQIQMEQDTAKTVQKPPGEVLLDFNRAGHPLIEVITLPQIHHPRTAAACVRKIQEVLQAVSAVTTGMELGGLRADVNVSVRRSDGGPGELSYHGVSGLGQRTEIKNLSSFKAIEDAIIAERDRQIYVLESGGFIEGETRGWAIGSTKTRKLRGKEGEVDYRYMPDPDLPPVIIGQSLVEHISRTLPMLPSAQAEKLVGDFGLTLKDAKTLISLDGGDRIDYFEQVIAACDQLSATPKDRKLLGRLVANWVLMELGSLISNAETEFSPEIVPASSLAAILDNLDAKKITGKTAKQLLQLLFHGDTRSVNEIIRDENLQIQYLTEGEYVIMAEELLQEHAEIVQSIRQGQLGKLQWFVGQMMRKGQGRVDAGKARKAIETVLGKG